jgi:outer membrane lipoprotein SlyB
MSTHVHERPSFSVRLRRATALIAALALTAFATLGIAQAQGPGKACTNCGVVESVTAVQHKAQPKGIAGTPVTPGTLIGGVVGGVLGNQIGHGGGRTIATVAGAAGGAYAGNAIEKNMKKTTAYRVHIRMANGSLRTIEQGNAVPVGSRVVVQGSSVRLASASRS